MVRQGCILVPTLSGIFFALLLKHAFKSSTDGVYLHSRSDGHLFNISGFHAKTKTKSVTIRNLLFADDVAMVFHQQDRLQRLMDKFSDASDFFSLTISQKKTWDMGQATPVPPCITVNGEELEVVQPRFHYHRYPMAGCRAHQVHRQGIDYSLKLTRRVWENKHLYKACIISSLLYLSESWSTYSIQEWKFQVFHSRCFCRILRVTWQDKMQNNDILSRAGIPSMFSLLCQPHLCWLGHIYRMEDGCIPKDLLYNELDTRARCRGHPQLHFKDICKHDMKACNIETKSWEAFGLKRGEAAI